MKYKLTLFLAGLALSGATGFGATIDLANLGGTFPSYTDSSGIPGLKITYVTGDAVGTTEQRGYSGDTGGMSLPAANFPDGHLAVGPGDTVTFDFSNVTGGGSVFIGFIDLDNNAFGGDESATVTSNGGTVTVDGASGQILNSQAHQAANIFNIGPVTPDGAGLIVVKAASAVDQGAAGNGFFAVTVSSDVVIPEPSAALLGLAGLGLLAFRRRRS